MMAAPTEMNEIDQMKTISVIKQMPCHATMSISWGQKSTVVVGHELWPKMMPRRKISEGNFAVIGGPDGNGYRIALLKTSRLTAATSTILLFPVEIRCFPAFKEFLMQYNKLSELCFNDCIHDFTSRTLKSSETNCTLNCMEKYLRSNQRVSQRFHEFQMIANENMLALAQKSGNTS